MPLTSAGIHTHVHTPTRIHITKNRAILLKKQTKYFNFLPNLGFDSVETTVKTIIRYFTI